MALSFNTNGWLELTWGTSPGLPLTLFAYGKTTAIGTRLAVSSGAPNGGDAVLVEVGALSSTGNAFGQHRTPGSSRSAVAASSMATGAWNPIMIHGQTTTPGTTLVHSAASTVVAEASGRTAQTHTRLRVGASANLDTPAAGAMWLGDLGEVGVWKGLTNTEAAAVHAAIVAGALPESQQTAKLVDVWDLQTLSGDGNYVGRVNGTVLQAHGSGITQASTHPISRTTAGPSITTQPSNATVTTPATATFTVAAAATGGGTLSYQWQRSTNSGGSWSNVSTGTGGTTASHTTPATSVTGGNANNADQYRCAVTETGGTNAGTTNSSAAILTVTAASGAIPRLGTSIGRSIGRHHFGIRR